MRLSLFTVCTAALVLAPPLAAQQTPQPQPFAASSLEHDTLPLSGQFEGVYIRTGDSLLILVSAAMLRSDPESGETRLGAVRAGLGESVADGTWSLAYASAPVPVDLSLSGGDAARLVTLAFLLRISPDADLSRYWIVFCLDDAAPGGDPLGFLHSDRGVFQQVQR
jgi:hypothetical protein